MKLIIIPQAWLGRPRTEKCKTFSTFFNIVSGFAHHQLPTSPQIIHSRASWAWRKQIDLHTWEQAILPILAAIYGKTSCKVMHLAVLFAWKSFAKCMKKLSYFIQKAMLDAAFCFSRLSPSTAFRFCFFVPLACFFLHLTCISIYFNLKFVAYTEP